MLRVRSLAKTYGETHALVDVDLDAERGRVLGIAGPNGAGKSTLVRILAGEETADAGSIKFDGEPLEVADLEVAVVHQEPQLFPNLTVGQNLLAAAEGTKWKWPRLSEGITSVLVDMELLAVAHRTLGTLPLAIQQRTEIARAVLRNAPLVLFDEPNSALTEEESQRLFEWMHRVADRGAVVLFISHRLSELVQHSESVVVLRDGRVASQLTGTFTQEQIARALVSDTKRGAWEEGTPRAAGGDRPIMRLKDWRSRRGQFFVPELEFREGEVIAVVGVEGSGGREFVASLAGFEPVNGRNELAAAGRLAQSPGDAQYLPASRGTSLFQNLSLAKNAVARLGRGRIASRSGLMRAREVHALGESARSRYDVACRSVEQTIASLSGGNQQKVAIAATLAAGPRIVAVEEPTRGVDVGSRAEIHRILRDYARNGALVAAFCTEVSEVMELADRVFVMDAGRLSAPLDVNAYDSAATLAADVTALERHSTVVAGLPQEI